MYILYNKFTLFSNFNYAIYTKMSGGSVQEQGTSGQREKERPPTRGGRIDIDYSLRFLAICDTLSILTISFAFAVIVYFPPQLRVISAFVSTASL